MSTTVSVVWVLRAVWIAATLPILIASIPSPRVSAIHGLLLRMAKRGKTNTAHSSKWGFSVPQKFFWHFYAVGVLWTTFLLTTTWDYAYRTAPSVTKSETLNRKWEAVFLLLLLETQVLRRLFESVYVFKYSPSARMNVFGYITGLLYYLAAPLSLCCTYASELLDYLTDREGIRMQEDLKMSPLLQVRGHVWMGSAVFFWGWIHQARCHAILGSLRENGGKVDEYIIPYGDWFEYVSSPHYLAEIVIYCGLIIASGFTDVTIWLVFGFVVANLGFAAAETHKWYIKKFDDYPKNRYAFIPFIY